jgi:cold shock CspA family protein
MERDGQLLPNRKGVLLLANKLDFVAGRVQGHRDGFGFLVADAGGQDIFLSPREMQKVLHGDRVLVKPTGEYRGKPEGTIVEVLERRTNRLVGRFLNERGMTIVVPEDQRIKHDVLIPPGDTGGAQHGQVVSVDIIEQPSRHKQPLGRVAEILGEIDEVVGVTGRLWQKMEGESLVRSLCRFQSGVVASFDVILATGAVGLQPHFQFTGTKGEIVISALGEVRLFDGKDWQGTVVGNGNYMDSYQGVWKDFEAAILDGTPLAADARYSLGEVAAANAIIRSAETKRWEKVW